MKSFNKILISQSRPNISSQYDNLENKFNVQIDFKPFFKIECIDIKDFRSQKLNILDYTAVVFSARSTIDAFFKICEELRLKMPPTMKYFCSSEAVAVYLQKHIVFRKRKVFYGDGSISSLIELMQKKHKDEKYLIIASDTNCGNSEFDKCSELDCTTGIFVKSNSEDLSDIQLSDYSVIVLYNPADLKSLKENFPDFSPKDTCFITYGRHVVDCLEKEGANIAIKAPNAQVSSVAAAIENYLENI